MLIEKTLSARKVESTFTGNCEHLPIKTSTSFNSIRDIMKITTEILESYMDLKKQAAELTCAEKEMRQAICSELLKGKTPGVHHSNYEYLRASATRKVTTSLDKQIVDDYKRGEFTETQEIMLTLKINLSAKEYKIASQADKDIIDNYITVKDAMPTLSIEEV